MLRPGMTNYANRVQQGVLFTSTKNSRETPETKITLEDDLPQDVESSTENQETVKSDTTVKKKNITNVNLLQQRRMSLRRDK